MSMLDSKPVRDQIFCQFYENTYKLISNSKEFPSQLPKEKITIFCAF